MKIGRIFGILLALSSPALAVSNRVFVSGTGADTGTCTLTAPCRSFAYAMTQVAPAGEVIALDTAGYGIFTINQTVTVFAPNGVTAFVAVPAGTGITIAAGATDAIVLRGLALSGNGGTAGIDFQSGHSLAVENCIVNGLLAAGVKLDRTTDSTNPTVRIENSTLRNNGNGVFMRNSGQMSPGGPPPGTAELTISQSSLSENGIGVQAGANTRAAITDTVISGNQTGVLASSQDDLSWADVNIERCTITLNSFAGIQAGPGTAVNSLRGLVRIAHDMITGNATSLIEYPGGTVESMNTGSGATNTIEGNGADVVPSATYTAK